MLDVAQSVCKFYPLGFGKFGHNCKHTTMLTYAQFLCFILIHALLSIPSLVYISADTVSASLAVVVPSSIQLLFLKLGEDLQLGITFLSIKEVQIFKLEVKVENMEIKLEARECVSPLQFICDLCDYCCSSGIVLQRNKEG